MLKLFDLLPGVIEAGAKADNGTGLSPQVVMGLNPWEIPCNSLFDLLISKPERDAVRDFLRFCGV